MSDLKDARDSIELVRLMQKRLTYEQQDREQMRNELEFAKAKINIRLDEMDRVDEMKGHETG